MTRPRASAPRATYRLQLSPSFTLDDATGVVPYLASLGVSHVYLSPILQAAAGSTHGYDVVDHGRVSDALGGEAAFSRLADAVRDAGMGIVLDIVPNHMAITEGNRWWWDVLQHGQASRYARYFDVDWDPPESRLRNVILLPVLPDHYGRVLEAGDLGLAREGSSVTITHGDRRFPLDPASLGPMVAEAGAAAASDELLFIGEALAALPAPTDPDPESAPRRQRDAEVLLARLGELLGDRRLARALDAAIRAVARDPDRLDALLEAQHYRLALWRAAARDLGYRRFFDIDELIGLRMEDPEVFAETHRLVLEWVREGVVDGLRIDHPDGLRDPAGYFRRLREAAPDAWIVAEKILAPEERLPADWPIDGTTGYSFANLATRLLVDGTADKAFSRLWQSRADAGPEWEEVAAEARAEVLTSVLGSDLNRLTDLFVAACEANRRFRDFTRHELHEALREVAVRLPVYRTYLTARPHHVTDADAARISAAADLARDERPDLDPQLFGLVGAILRLEVEHPLATELAMRFQQLTPAAMAKGVEDTAFYRHHRLVALNEVGGEPDWWSVDADRFHTEMTEVASAWPGTMNALSTHDTKRSADVRARLAALTVDPAGWRRTVGRLSAAARPHRSGRGRPTDADAYLLFQIVVGAWPIDTDRAVAYLEKASREGKLRTSWTAPDAAYDEARDAFVRGCLSDPAFTSVVEDVVAGVADAWAQAALAQQALQLLVPGVPDLYGGTELWDLSLVDPDNRRPVDWALRRRLLDEVTHLDAASAWRRREEGVAKLWLVHRLLDLRRRRPEAFGPDAGYRPVDLRGAGAGTAVAFLRGETVLGLVAEPSRRPMPARAALDLPEGRWCGLDGVAHSGRVAITDLLAAFPVAVLERET